MALMKSPREKKARPERPLAQESALERWATASPTEVSVVASSYDPRHSPGEILDGSHNTFWVSTGMFPQELVLGFRTEVKISEVKTTTRNVRQLSLDRIIPGQAVTSNGQPGWKNVATKELIDAPNKMQVETFMLNNLSTRFLRLTLESGYDHFAAVYSVRIQTAEGKWLS